MEDAPDPLALAKRDQTIESLGGGQFQLPKAHIESTYGVTLETRSAVPDTRQVSAQGKGEAPQFAEQDTDPLVHALDAIDNEDWEALASPLIQPILDKAKAEPEVFIAELAALYPELSTDALTEQLTQILFVADTWGRLQAEEDA